MRGRFTGKAGVVSPDISWSVHALHLRAVMSMTDCTKITEGAFRQNSRNKLDIILFVFKVPRTT